MNNISSRHHYIPQFYLKGFLNQKQTFAIYDKKTDRIKKGEYSTKSHFFEENRNIIESNGAVTDILETKVYKSIDDDAGLLFKEIEDKGLDFLTFKNLFPIKFFISFLHWRIPSNDKLLEETIEKIEFNELVFMATSTEDGRPISMLEFKKRFKNDSAFRKLVRIMLPFGENNTFTISPHIGEEDMWKAIGYPNEGFYLTCDNPIITLRKDMFYGQGQKLLFPITSKKVIYYGETSRNTELPPNFNIQMDLAIMHVAERYVCGPNKKYLEDIKELYDIERRFDKTDEIIPKLFEFFG